MSDQSVIDKLKKLVEHEKSARSIGSIAEAEAFAARIQSLLFNHKLTMSDVEYKAQAKSDPFGRASHGVSYGVTPQWRITLSDAVARSFFCRSFFIKGTNKVMFVGRDSDRAATIQMYEYLGGLCKSIGSKEWKTARLYHPANYKPKWDKAFRLGFADAIAKRLKVNALDLSAGAAGYALMKREDHAVELFVEQTMRLGKPSSRTIVHNSDAYARGQVHGSQVSLKSKTALGSGS